MKRTNALTKMLVGLVLLLGLGLQLGVAQASPAADPGTTANTVELLSYGASGYRYLEFGASTPATPPTDFDEPGFDDSAFGTGAAGFGYFSNAGGCGNPPITAWSENSNLVVRKEITVPAGATGLRIMIAIDNDIEGVFFNGTRLPGQYPFKHDGCAHKDSFRFDIPQSLVLTGLNLVAFHVLDRGGQTFFDTRILAEGVPPVPETPDAPAFSLDTALPTVDACLCMPPYMVIPDGNVHNWWVRSDGGELRITPIAVGVNILEIGDVNFEVFDPSGASVASRTISYVGLGGGDELAAADVVVTGTSDGDLYRVEVTLTPPPPPPPVGPGEEPDWATAHHYRLETKGASLIGANSPLQTNAEPIPTTWAVNVGSGEDLDVVVEESPEFPGATGTVEVRDPSGALVTTVGIGDIVSVSSAAAGTWTVKVSNATGHYVIDKQSGSDTGIYLNWASFGTGTLTVNPLQLGLPYLGPYRVRIEDVETGVVGTEPPGPLPFSGGAVSIPLEVGEYRVQLVSFGRTTDWANVSVTCNGDVTVTLDLPALPVNIDLKPGSWPNSINLNGNGVQAVALFGSPRLDVANVDVDSVRFGVVGDEAAAVHSGHIQDVNGDLFPDIVFHFRELEMGILADTPGETTLNMHLTGLLSPSGVAFVGTDVARITPNNSKSRGKGGKGPM